MNNRDCENNRKERTTTIILFETTKEYHLIVFIVWHSAIWNTVVTSKFHDSTKRMRRETGVMIHCWQWGREFDLEGLLCISNAASHPRAEYRSNLHGLCPGGDRIEAIYGRHESWKIIRAKTILFNDLRRIILPRRVDLRIYVSGDIDVFWRSFVGLSVCGLYPDTKSSDLSQ